MKKRLLITLLLALPLSLLAQFAKIAGDPRGTALYFDLNRLWSYNLYEQSRWGAGLRLTAHPSGYEGRWTAVDVYAGYGYADHQWKGGVKFSTKIDQTTLYMSVSRDYERAAARQFSTYDITDIGSLSAFLTRRLSDKMMATVGYRRKGRVELGAEVSAWSGRHLFDGSGLLYLKANDSLPTENGTEVHLSMVWKHLKADAWLGRTWPKAKTIARILAQYEDAYSWQVVKLSWWTQGGLTPPGTPYTRMFDLGGTYDAPILFDHALLTASPNEFTANVFAIGSVRVATARPLWNVWSPYTQTGSHAVPFVQLTAAWGHLWNQDNTGRLDYEDLPLQAPSRGLVETVAGIEGLARIGVVDWGVAAAWRIVPWNDNYPTGTLRHSPTLLLTARLIF